MYGEYFSNPSVDSIILLHIERPYIRAVHRGFVFNISQKLKKEKKILQNI